MAACGLASGPAGLANTKELFEPLEWGCRASAVARREFDHQLLELCSFLQSSFTAKYHSK